MATQNISLERGRLALGLMLLILLNFFCMSARNFGEPSPWNTFMINAPPSGSTFRAKSTANTPNIHLCTFKDFERLCHDNNIRILDTIALWDNPNPKIPAFIRNQAVKTAPNLLADVGMYRIVRG